MKLTKKYEPDDFEKQLYSEVLDKFEVLQQKHGRRKRSPLKFVEAYDDFSAAFGTLQIWSWPEIESTVERLKQNFLSFKDDYINAIGPAKDQRERNKLWEQIYNPPPPTLQGGRADGNS